MTRVAIRFAKDVIEALRLCGRYIRIEGGQIGSYRRLGHQILQQAAISRTKRTTVVMLGNPRIAWILESIILRRDIDVRGDQSSGFGLQDPSIEYTLGGQSGSIVRRLCKGATNEFSPRSR